MPEFEIIVDEWTSLDSMPLWTVDIVRHTAPELSLKRKLLRDRVKLIRAIQSIKHGSYAKTMDELYTLRLLAMTIRADNDNHFLSYSQEDKRMVSYAVKPQHKHDNDKRHKTTIGRYIRKQLKVDSDTISDRTLENLAYNLFGELADPDDLPIEVITGEAITKAYYNGVGGDTCMAYEHSRYTKIYEMNPDKVAMVLYDNNARALLWTTDEGAVILDRIYPNDGSHTRAMNKWAMSKGYIIRDNNHCADCDDPRLLGREQYHVTLKHNDVFPYMDTFMHGSTRDGHIIVSNLPMDDDDVILQEQNGTYYTGIACCRCEEHIPEDSIICINGESYCESCYDEWFAICDRCGNDIDRDNIHEVDGSKYWCGYCVDEHAQECYACNECFADYLYAVDTGRYYCQSCNELTERVDCNELVEEIIDGDDGTSRCEECHKEYEESQIEPAPVM